MGWDGGGVGRKEFYLILRLKTSPEVLNSFIIVLKEDSRGTLYLIHGESP